MEPSSRRRESKTPRRRPVVSKEQSTEHPLPELANLSLEGSGTDPPKPEASEGKTDTTKKPKRTFADLRPAVQALLSDCFSKLNLVPTDLDPSIYDSLLDFPEHIQYEIVASFCRADLASIRNKTGYFIGILKQYRKNGKAGNSLYSLQNSSYNPLPFQYMNPTPSPFLVPSPFGNFFPNQYTSFSPYNYGLLQARQARELGFADRSSYYASFPAYNDMYNLYGQGMFPASYLLPAQQLNLSPSFSKISPKSQTRLAHLYNIGLIRRTDLEDCVFDSLADFPEADQLRMCDAFAQANLVNVRNKTAFFIGILKRHRSQRQSPETQQPAS